jgi:flagellar motor component MotA
MFILGIIVFLAGILITAFIMASSPGDVAILINFPTIFILVWAAGGVTLATGNIRTYITAVNALISKKYFISAADKEKAIRYLKLMARTMIYTSVLITLLSLLMLLLTLNDPFTLGPKAAVALTSLFYGILVNLIFVYPAIYVLESRYNHEEKRVISEKQVMDKLLELCYKQGITPEEIMDAGEIHFPKQ